MAESHFVFNRQQKQRRNWSWMMMKDKVKIEEKNEKKKTLPLFALRTKLLSYDFLAVWHSEKETL